MVQVASIRTSSLGVVLGRWPSVLERWPGMATGHSRPVSNPTSVKTFRFGTLAIPFTPSLPVSFGGDTNSRRSLLSGVYARGSKIYHQSALECVTVVDSCSHSKKKQKCVYAAKRCPALNKEEEEV